MRNILRALCAIICVLGIVLSVTGDRAMVQAGAPLALIFGFLLALLFVKRVFWKQIMASCQEDWDDQQERTIALMRRMCDPATKGRTGKRLPLLLIVSVVFLLFVGLAIVGKFLSH
jgi:hypothetical protein